MFDEHLSLPPVGLKQSSTHVGTRNHKHMMATRRILQLDVLHLHQFSKDQRMTGRDGDCGGG